MLPDARTIWWVRWGRQYLVFLGHEAEHRGGQPPQQHDESPFTEKMMATLRAVAQGNLSACPDVRVKEIDSEVFACSSSH